MKKLREIVNWDIENERFEFLRRIDYLILHWEGEIPDLRGMFRTEEIDRLLFDTIIFMNKGRFFVRGERFIGYVARSGYKDEPKLDEDGAPLLRRTTPLHHAFRCHLTMLDELFQIYDRFDGNYINESGLSHFHVACSLCYYDAVEKFLDHGQDPNCILPQTGESPLHLALGRGHNSLVELLLRSGADPNWANKEGSTALHIIFKRDRQDYCVLAKMLFELSDKKYQPLQVNPRDNLGSTPLHMALSLERGRMEIVKFFLKIGANPNVANAEGWTPLKLLFNKNYDDKLAKTFFEICAEKKQPVEVNAKDKLGQTPLQLAVANILPNAVDLLLEQGADLTDYVFPPASYLDEKPYSGDYTHNFDLRLASGALTIAERLEKSGYELDQSGSLKIMKLFVKHRWFEKPFDTEKAWCDDKNFRSKAREIMVKPDLSLYDLVQLRPEEAAKLVTYADYFRLWSSERFIGKVASSGYKVQPRLEDGVPLLQRTTPLHHAFRYSSLNLLADTTIAELFAIYNNRYDANFTDESGLSHFHVACRLCYYDAVKKFLDHGQDPNSIWRETGQSPLHLILNIHIKGRKEIVKCLLENGANPNVADAKGWTPLHVISQKCRDVGLPNALFQFSQKKYHPLKIDAQNKSGWTPLHLALYTDNHKVLEILLKKGADSNVIDSKQFTPLHVICDKKYDNGIAQTFFKFNDDNRQLVQVNARDHLGRTPLYLAVENFLPSVVDLILNRGADLTDFVFPPASYLDDKPSIREWEDECDYFHNYHLRIASGALTIAERLEKSGYELDQSRGLMIMKLFAKHRLFEKSSDTVKAWCDDKNFTSKAKEIIVKPNLSLYDLVQLRPEEAKKLLTYADYFKFSRFSLIGSINKLYTMHRRDCALHLIEQMSREFFRTYSLDCFWKLIHYRLPIECCDIILDELNNEDLYNICLAATDKEDSKKDVVTRARAKKSPQKNPKKAKIAKTVKKLNNKCGPSGRDVAHLAALGRGLDAAVAQQLLHALMALGAARLRAVAVRATRQHVPMMMMMMMMVPRAVLHEDGRVQLLLGRLVAVTTGDTARSGAESKRATAYPDDEEGEAEAEAGAGEHVPPVVPIVGDARHRAAEAPEQRQALEPRLHEDQHEALGYPSLQVPLRNGTNY
ncbi:unnamed protein product [Trichogramma brassicae]|uniref:Uncharacterized protein n=1 Tax=Trichogramma brassicae TaxID=86971 RepID=A0A6H5I7P7_9HYME|nr:unnamed protein product [Trichogramma brassicae]